MVRSAGNGEGPVTLHFGGALARELNDVHSQLNHTIVARIERPRTLAQSQSAIVDGRKLGDRISAAGVGMPWVGQQFAAGSVHIDTSALNRVLHSDSERGLLHIEAGADWPAIIAASRQIVAGSGSAWASAKADRRRCGDVGGSISANAHGRGLLMQPIGDDIEDLTSVDGAGQALVVLQSRMELGALSACRGRIRSLWRHLLGDVEALATPARERVVDIIDLDDGDQRLFRRCRGRLLVRRLSVVIDAQCGQLPAARRVRLLQTSQRR